MRQGPLAGRYPAAASMVIFALVPYLALTGALNSLTPFIGRDLHIGAQAMSLTNGMANAGYAVGTVLAMQLAQRLPQRRMMVLYATMLVIGSVLTAAAQDPGMYIAGHILQGLSTSLLLIGTVPPLFVGYPASKFRTSAVIMTICIFGAVALGPTIGGIQANAAAWRPLFWIVTGVAAAALVLSVLTFEDAPPAAPDSPWDPIALGLAAVGSVAAFYGAAELLTHKFLGPMTGVPLIGGLLLILVLLVYQYRAKQPLLNIKSMVTSTIPTYGIVIALTAAAASVSVIELSAMPLSQRYGPLHLGLLYLPEFAGAMLSVAVVGVVVTRRQIHLLPLAGMLFLAAGIVAFRIKVPSTEALTLVGSGLTGIGLGATVAPALQLAGFALPVYELQRVYAMVELLRAVAAFMVAPVFAHFAATVGGSPTSGTETALWIALGLALGGGAAGALLYQLGRVPIRAPDLQRFMTGKGPACESPPLLGGLREPAVRLTEQGARS